MACAKPKCAISPNFTLSNTVHGSEGTHCCCFNIIYSMKLGAEKPHSDAVDVSASAATSETSAGAALSIIRECALCHSSKCALCHSSTMFCMSFGGHFMLCLWNIDASRFGFSEGVSHLLVFSASLLPSLSSYTGSSCSSFSSSSESWESWSG